jgi:hypothetical protein
MPDRVPDPDDWSGYDTPAHSTAQDACRHIIVCAVDATTRRQVSQGLDYARRVGDVAAFPLLLAQLTDPCCLPPDPAPAQSQPPSQPPTR